jgi:quaternary ammonium compound-resistance protein SugE
MHWIYLLTAGLLEIVWAVGLKFTHGWTRLGPSLGTALAMAASFFLLARAIQSIPIGTAYAIWTGIGAAGTAALGMLFFGESASPLRLLSLAFIVAGILGLRLSA